MEFDITFCKTNNSECRIDYGVVFGNEKIFFIKSGKGGTHRGEDDKYIKMAHRLHAKWGCTVICSSNPVDCPASYDSDKEVICEYVKEKGFDSFELDLIGSSNGAYQILFLANQLQNTRKIMCINMPLMLNYHKALDALSMMETVEKIFVYGTRDPSYSYVPFLETKKLPLLNVIRVDGADHVFKNRLDDFIALADLI